MSAKRSVRCFGAFVATMLVVGACSGDDDSPGGGDALERVPLQPMSGTINQILSDDLTIDYTIDLPDGFEIADSLSSSQQTWEDPDVEFGVAEITTRLSWTTVQYDADTLRDDALAIADDRQILENGSDDAGFAFVTFASPSESSDAIFSASAQTSRSLGDDSVLICTTTWSTGIEDTWSDDDVATAAAQSLDICGSFDAA